MIIPFWGELLFHKVPLELSFNPCSYKCGYCFNILNGMNKHCDMTKLTNLICDFQDRKTYEAKLLQMGYPVLMSNRSDPFCSKNAAQALPTIKMMKEVGIPMAFQTKGEFKKGIIDEVISILNPPTCWYITITHSDDGTRKVFEPAAPDINSRFELIEKLRANGHRVQVGVNPMVPEWIGFDDKVDSFIQRLKDAACESVWCEKIHFNRSQIKNMDYYMKESFGDIIDSGLKNPSAEFTEYIKAFRQKSIDAGIIFGGAYDWNTTYWDAFDETYPVLFPNTIDFIRHCFEHVEDDGVIAYSYFKKHIVDKFPKGRYSNIQNYIKNKGFRMAKKYVLKPKMTFDEIMRIMWFDPKSGKMAPGVKEWYAQIQEYEPENDRNVIPVDEDGMPFYMFRRTEFNSYAVDFNGKEA